MAEISGPPAVDFYGMLSGLGDTIRKRQQEQMAQQKEQAGLAAFSQLDPNSPNYMAAAQAAFQTGNMEAGQKLLALKIADDERKHTLAREGVTDSRWAQEFALKRAAAARANDPTPTGFMKRDDGTYGPLPGGPQDPTYMESVAAAKARAAALAPPDGFVRQPDGSVTPIPGGPQDPTYQGRVAAETARAKGDVPTVIGSGSSVIIPNKASEGAIFTNKPAAESNLDDDTIKAMAEQARAGDTSVFQNLGRGQQGAENIVRLRKEMIRQNNEAGVSGSEQALRNAEMMGVKAGQRTIGTKGANIEMAATEFNQVLPVVQAASQAVSRTNYPDLNKIILQAQARTGDPNVVKLGGGVNTLINLYARAISPSGTPTVSDKDHAREILSAAWSGGQFDAAVGMMQQEIKAALSSPEKVRDEMRSRFLKGQGAAPVGYPAPGGAPAQPNVTKSGVPWSIQ